MGEAVKWSLFAGGILLFAVLCGFWFVEGWKAAIRRAANAPPALNASTPRRCGHWPRDAVRISDGTVVAHICRRCDVDWVNDHWVKTGTQ